MVRTVFKISKMDCPAEEGMVRIKLDGLNDIQSLKFDLSARQLEVYHTGDPAAILAVLDSLGLDTTLVSSTSTDVSGSKAVHRQERRVLWQVLVVNFSFFALEMFTGFIARSMGLVGDSLDMLADSIVYAMSLFAVGGTVARKKKIARAAGYFQLGLAILGLGEVVRRFLGHEENPEFQLMIIISILALAGNALCLYLLHRSRSREAHMQASMIFTSSDVIANLGVVLAGILVYMTASKAPDLAIGAIVFFLVARGAYRILQLSK